MKMFVLIGFINPMNINSKKRALENRKAAKMQQVLLGPDFFGLL
jgi:hypothetical protein